MSHRQEFYYHEYQHVREAVKSQYTATMYWVYVLLLTSVMLLSIIFMELCHNLNKFPSCCKSVHQCRFTVNLLLNVHYCTAFDEKFSFFF